MDTRRTNHRTTQVWLSLAMLTLLTGCLSGEEEAAANAPAPIDPTTNSAPTISGNPPAAVTIGENYSFMPSASDADGDTLTFSVSNLPSWASFDSSTGAVTGNPTLGDVGVEANIAISVTDGIDSASLPQFDITVNQTASPANSAPTISGNPPVAVTIGQSYSFTPVASDADGDTLTFSVSNLPSWASFDSSTGTVTGSPSMGNVGVDANIVISVTDGTDSASLPQFDITVSQVQLSSVTLSWTAPTQNSDGSPLTDLAGYNLYYGTSPGTYTNSLHISNPGLTTYVVENLSPATYYFVATSENSSGVESLYTNEVTRVVN